VISLVRGEVAVRRPDHVVIDCGGVGYRLAVSAETLKQVPGAGKAATLHAHLVVRDDALALYGFSTEEERDLFLMLLGVQAVGPKVALAVLSGGPPRGQPGARLDDLRDRIEPRKLISGGLGRSWVSASFGWVQGHRSSISCRLRRPPTDCNCRPRL